MTTSDIHFVLTMFFVCMGCFGVLTALFVVITQRQQQKGSRTTAWDMDEIP